MPILKPKGYIRSNKLGAVQLYSKVVSAGASITSQTAANQSGFVVTWVSTGLYRLTFADNWDSMLFIKGLIYNAGTAVGQFVELKAKLSSKVADIHVVNDAGSVEDVVSGNELWIEATMSNTSVG